ncbi:hypothetical protein Mkiyose1088_13880 [Mycobacterium kiyosense]|uniref:hypothetical protein n=1 Tax=Mycobacterium TaxID=1763 RepID=UPI001EEFE8A3|nr:MULTISPECIES: hypothetical protein [Mycobacterium]BDB41980.1 hypothetical protein IWGMT90018_24260 [Mycobacterium kiyosense]BDE14737.1 hypothetical protein MKCMC460_35970 [Mycobacterium sp. 20KCMC460]GLC03583.1 hypothetical protein SRL2020400_41740 [Mycobacterium kiyosense]GLC99521.1 hypothetical protein Mkiyose1088_13880 [Mycobacterium kiyosense]GLD07263.1 hypothetical protein Mkiyose1383_35890 [Mycobacterium kiyosense]
MSDPTQNRPDAAERERARAAVELRVQGHPFAHIAAQLGYADESGARHAVSRSLARREAESIDELRAVHSARLETVLSSFWSGMVSGDADAAKIVLRALDSLAKLFGLDAPTKVALGPPVSEVDYANEAAQLIERLQAQGELGEFVAGLRAQAVADVDSETAVADGDYPGAQLDARSAAHSGELPPDDLAGWSNIGDPMPAPADPAAPPAIAPVPEPEPEPLPAPQPVQSQQPAAPPAWMRRNIGGDGYNPTSGWRP